MIHIREMGLRIAALRRKRGLTQVGLAELMGVTPQAVSKWERGLACPDLIFLDELSAALGVTIDSLLTGRGLAESA